MKRPAFFVSRLYGAIAGHDGLEGTTKDRTGNHPASTDNLGPARISRDISGQAGIIQDGRGSWRTARGRGRQ